MITDAPQYLEVLIEVGELLVLVNLRLTRLGNLAGN